MGASVLAFASYTDWRWRRAPNVLWLVIAGAGLALLGVEAVLDWRAFAARWPYLVGAPVFIALIYGLWYFGLIAGGADAKALMAIALLAPFPLALGDGIPLLQAPVPGAFSVLGNSLILFLVIPIAFLVWNLAHGALRFPHLFLGIKRRAADVRRGHAWPMEIVDETGARKTKLFASRMSDSEIEETFDRVQALGDERVWVSPKIPFMIPMLAGYVSAYFVGDMMIGIMMRVLPSG